MEKLTKRSDGIVETSSGFFAVVPLIKSGRTADGLAWFAFKGHVLGPSIRVEWDPEYPLGIFEAETALTLVQRGYAKNPTSEQVDEHNRLVDEWLKNNPQDEAKKADETEQKSESPSGDDASKGLNDADLTSNASQGDTSQPVQQNSTDVGDDKQPPVPPPPPAPPGGTSEQTPAAPAAPPGVDPALFAAELAKIDAKKKKGK